MTDYNDFIAVHKGAIEHVLDSRFESKKDDALPGAVALFPQFKEHTLKSSELYDSPHYLVDEFATNGCFVSRLDSDADEWEDATLDCVFHNEDYAYMG